MKNRVLQSCSLFVVAFLLAVVSARAQMIEVYHADIPFEFTIGNDTYEAGEYAFSLKSVGQLASVLKINDEKGQSLREVAVMKNGSSSENKKAMLVFNRYGKSNVLEEIVVPDAGFNAPKSKVTKRFAKKAGQKSETVAVVLRKKEKKT